MTSFQDLFVKSGCEFHTSLFRGVGCFLKKHYGVQEFLAISGKSKFYARLCGPEFIFWQWIYSRRISRCPLTLSQWESLRFIEFSLNLRDSRWFKFRVCASPLKWLYWIGYFSRPDPILALWNLSRNLFRFMLWVNLIPCNLIPCTS